MLTEFIHLIRTHSKIRFPNPRDRSSLLASVTVLAISLGVYLRCDGLSRQSLWLDEVYTAERAASGSISALFDSLEDSPFPPLYYVALWVWIQIWGLSETTLRSLSAVVGVMTLFATFTVWRGLIGRSAILWAMTFLAINAFHVGYSQDAKMYAMVWLLSVVSSGAFLHLLLQSPARVIWIVTYGVSTACLPMVSYVGFAPIAAQALFGFGWMIMRRRVEPAALRWLGALVVAMVPTEVWWPHTWFVATRRIGIEWIPKTDPLAAILDLHGILNSFLLGFMPPRHWPEHAPWTFPLLLLEAVSCVILPLLLIASLRRTPHRAANVHDPLLEDRTSPNPHQAPVVRFLALWFVAPLIGAIAFSLTFYSLWGIPRFLTASAPALTLWLGVVVSSGRLPRLARSFTVIVLVANLSVVLITRNYDVRIPWRAMAQSIVDFRMASCTDLESPVRVLVIPGRDGNPLETKSIAYALGRHEALSHAANLRVFGSAAVPESDAPFFAVELRPGRIGAGTTPFAYDRTLLFCRRILDYRYTPVVSPFSTTEVIVWKCTGRATSYPLPR